MNHVWLVQNVYTPRWYDHPNTQGMSRLPERQQIIKIFVPKSVFPSQHYRRVLLLSDFEALLSVTSNLGFSSTPTPYQIPSACAPWRLVLLQSNFLSRELESDSVFCRQVWAALLSEGWGGYEWRSWMTKRLYQVDLFSSHVATCGRNYVWLLGTWQALEEEKVPQWLKQ